MAKNTVFIEVIVDDKGTTERLAVNANKLKKAMVDTEKGSKGVGRAQRGMAQTASSAGKNFANLSSGISGGLVPAYATLAAQIFAVTAAFGFLKEAGALRQLQQGQVAYAATVGTSMKSLTDNIVAATDAQINFRDASQAAAIGTAAGLSAQQLVELGAAARITSITLGRDLTDSFNRLIRGVTKAEPELLDELGIILRLEKATNDYAIALGKNANDLSAFERSQAVTRDVLAQVDEKFGNIADSGLIASNEFAKLGKAFDDLINQVRGLAVELAGPIATTLTQFPALIALAFAPFTAQIAKAALPQLDNLGDKLDSVTLRAEEMYDSLTEKQEEFAVQQRKSLDPKEAKKAISQRGKAVASQIASETKLRKNSLITTLRDSGQLENNQIRNLKRSLNKQDGLYSKLNKKRKKELLSVLTEMEVNNKRVAGKMAADTAAGINKTKVRFVSLGVTASKAFTKVAVGARVAGAAIAGLFSFLSIASTVALVGSLAFSFFRTKEEVTKTSLKADELLRTLENINKENEAFAERQEAINSSLERGLQAITAFGARVANIPVESLESTVDANMFKDAGGSLAEYTNQIANLTAREKRRLELLNFNINYSKNKLKVDNNNIKAQRDLAKEEAEREAILSKYNKTYFDFVIQNEKSSPIAKELATQLKAQLDFLNNTTNEYLKSTPAVEQYRAALEELDKTGKNPEGLDIARERFLLLNNAINSFTVEQTKNIQAVSKIFSKFLPENEFDSAIRGLKLEASLIDVIDKETGKLLEKEVERKKLIEDQISLLTRINEQKQQELRLTSAIDNAEKQLSIGKTRLVQQEIKLSAAILKEQKNILLARQAQQNIIDATPAKLDQELSLVKEGNNSEQERLDITQRINGEKERELERQNIAIQRSETQLELLRRQKDEMKQIQDSAAQALETGLQSKIAAIIKGQENSIKDAILGIAQGIGNAIADTLAKQFTTKIMSGLFGIKSPEELMKEKVVEGIEAGAQIQYKAIVDASLTGSEFFKKAIIESSGGTYTSTPTSNASPGGAQGALASGTSATPQKRGLFATLFGTKGNISVTSQAEDGSEVVTKTPGRVKGMFGPFLNDFAGIFDAQKREGGFLAQLGKTFLSGASGFSALFEGLLGGIGGGGGFLSSILSFLPFRYGGIASYRYGGMRDRYSTGGIARGPQAGYPAMLHGNEAVVPLPNGNKIPVEMRGGAMSNNIGITVNIDNQGNAQSDASAQPGQGARLGKAISMAVQEELQRQKRPGGILSPYGAA